MRGNNGTTSDLTGRVFGLLTVVARAANDAFGRVYWRCVCRCDASALKCAHQLRAGKFFTCGAPGFSLQGLAEKYGVGYATIQRVLQVSVTIGKDS